jgi:hypothetical protein
MRGSTGTRPAGADQQRAGSREQHSPEETASADRRVTVHHTGGQRLKSRTELLKSLTVGGRHGPDHHIARPGHGKQVSTHQLSQASLQAISVDRGVSEAWHHHTNPHKRRGGRTRPNDERTRLQSPSLLTNPLNVLAPSESRRTWIPQGLCGVLRRQLHRQALPPLLPAPTQDRASPSRGHPGAKTMCPDSALVAGTVCWLAHLLNLQTIDFWFMHKEG